MGFVKVRVKVWNIENPRRSRELELLADTARASSRLFHSEEFPGSFPD